MRSKKRRTSSHEAPCKHCGRLGHDHQKRKKWNDNGPTGTYAYDYFCRGMSTTYEPK